MNKKSPDLGHLIDPPKDLDQPGRSPSAGAGCFSYNGEVSCSKTNQRIDLIKAGSDNLSGLSRPQLFARIRVNNLNNFVIRDMHSALLHAFVSEASDIRRPVGLANDHPKFLFEADPQGFRKHLCGNKANFEIEIIFQIDPHLRCLFSNVEKETWSSTVSGCLEIS